MHKNLITYLLVFAAICSCQSLRAGGETQSSGAKSIGLGGCSVMQQDIWSAFNNQAGLIGLEGLNAGGFYRNSFGISGLNDQGLALAYGQEKRAFAFNVSNFGTEHFRESRVGLAYAMGLGEKLNMGVQLNYHSMRVGNDGSNRKGALTAELSLLSQVTEKLDVGLRLFNPTQTKLSDYEDERIPTVMTLGGSYTFNKKVSLVSEVSKDMDRPTIVRAGVEYRVVDTVYLRGGVSTEPTLSSFGAGLLLGQLNLDIAASFHHSLGYSTQISLSYRFSGDE